MGFIDNAIAAISPQWAYKRECFKQGLDALRSNYDAASYDKANSRWRTSNESADVTDKFERDTVRARARDLERNSDIMNSVIGAFKRNVVGSGFHVQAKTPDESVNTQLETLWKEWCKKQNCDVTGTQSLNQMIRMAVARKKIDGGIIFVKVYTKTGVVPFKLQLFEVDELDDTTFVRKNKANRLVDGVEYDRFNKPVGYHIKQYSIDGMETNESKYIPARDVIFYFAKKRPSQLREISDMAPTITRVRDANEFIGAVSIKERVNACLAVFIKHGIPSVGIGRNPGATSEGGRVTYEGKTLTPGMIKELNAGDEIQVVNPSGQATDASTFTKQQLRLIGAGQGLSYEATSRDMSQSNYSSARQGNIEDALTYEEEIELLLEVLDEIYETFVISAFLCGAVKMSNPIENKDMLRHEWAQPPKPWIDPAKESNANMVALRSGQKTFKAIAAENGKDWRDMLRDMADVIEEGKKLGIDMMSIIYGIQQQNMNGGDSNGKSEEADTDEV